MIQALALAYLAVGFVLAVAHLPTFFKKARNIKDDEELADAMEEQGVDRPLWDLVSSDPAYMSAIVVFSLVVGFSMTIVAWPYEIVFNAISSNKKES